MSQNPSLLVVPFVVAVVRKLFRQSAIFQIRSKVVGVVELAGTPRQKVSCIPCSNSVQGEIIQKPAVVGAPPQKAEKVGVSQ